MNKELNDIYHSSLEKEDDFGKAVDLLRNNPNYLGEILWAYLRNEISDYIVRKGEHGMESEVLLARLVPDLFAKCFRSVILGLKYEVENPDVPHDELKSEHSFKEIVEWLEQNHPDQLRDALIEYQEMEDGLNSPATKEYLRKTLENIQKIIRNRYKH